MLLVENVKLRYNYLNSICYYFLGLDGDLKTFDINSAADNTVGQHDSAIRCVEFSTDVNAVGTIKL